MYADIRIVGPVRLEHAGGEWWRVISPIECTWVGPAPGRVVVPVGEVTDLATIPRWLRSILPQVGDWNAPAIVHDYLYDRPEGMTRAQVDRLFLASLELFGVSRWRRYAMYAAVRALGWAYWGPPGGVRAAE